MNNLYLILSHLKPLSFLFFFFFTHCFSLISAVLLFSKVLVLLACTLVVYCTFCLIVGN